MCVVLVLSDNTPIDSHINPHICSHLYESTHTLFTNTPWTTTNAGPPLILPYKVCMLLLLLLFLTFSVLVANPKKLLYTVANPARGLLNREKRTKEKVWQHTPPPTPHTARSEKINKITRRIYRRYAGGRSRVRTRIPSARRLGLWVWLRNSTLPSAIIRFPVSLLLSSPGDV